MTTASKSVTKLGELPRHKLRLFTVRLETYVVAAATSPDRALRAAEAYARECPDDPRAAHVEAMRTYPDGWDDTSAPAVGDVDEKIADRLVEPLKSECPLVGQLIDQGCAPSLSERKPGRFDYRKNTWQDNDRRAQARLRRWQRVERNAELAATRNAEAARAAALADWLPSEEQLSDFDAAREGVLAALAERYPEALPKARERFAELDPNTERGRVWLFDLRGKGPLGIGIAVTDEICDRARSAWIGHWDIGGRHRPETLIPALDREIDANEEHFNFRVMHDLRRFSPNERLAVVGVLKRQAKVAHERAERVERELLGHSREAVLGDFLDAGLAPNFVGPRGGVV